MSLDLVINLNISVTSRAPTQQGFGTPLYAVYHNNYLDLVREYAEPSELLDDGFTTSDPAYLMAQAHASASPHPPTFKIGRRQSAYTQQRVLEFKNTTEGFEYDYDIGGENVTYVVPAAATGITVATANHALINALAGAFTSTDGLDGTLTVNADTAGVLFDFDMKAMDHIDDLGFEETTPDPGLAADLTAIRDIDDDWYGIALDSQSTPEALAFFAWLETQKKIAVVTSMQSDVADVAVSSDLASTLMAASYSRAVPLMTRRHLLDYRAVTDIALMLPNQPGSVDWALKTLPGIQVDSWRPSQQNAITDKNASVYVNIGSTPQTWEMKTPNGDFIDVPHFVDWLHARIRESVFAALSTPKKVPYTDAGVGLVANAIRAVLRQGVTVGGLRADPAPTVTFPAVASVPLADRANRRLPNGRFTAELAGSIHHIVLNGNITV